MGDEINGAPDTPTPDELLRVALGLLGYAAEARRVLDLWEPRLLQVAKDSGASNPQIAAALGVRREAARRRLLKEPGAVLRGAPKKSTDGLFPGSGKKVTDGC